MSDDNELKIGMILPLINDTDKGQVNQQWIAKDWSFWHLLDKTRSQSFNIFRVERIGGLVQS